MSLKHLAALVVAAVALAATGCGSSSKIATTTTATTTAASTPQATTSTSTPTTHVASKTTLTFATGTPLSRTTWIAKGDAICAHTNTEMTASQINTPQDYARVFPQAALYDKAEAVELSHLVPPASKEADWKQIVNALQLFGEYTAKVGEYAQANNLEAAKPLLDQAEGLHEQMVALAKRDGFVHCSVL